MSEYNVFNFDGGVPIKAWTKGLDIEASAMLQLKNVASLPFVHKHVAVMPDVHWGMGATIGSVIATRGAIVPAAVGVDIGCGMMAVRTRISASRLPDNLHQLRLDIEAAVPHGRSNNGGPGDRGAWHDVSAQTVDVWAGLEPRYKQIVAKHPRARGMNSINHLGTLGTGNHFVELCLDEEQQLWIMLHSGSRGVGNKIGMYFIEQAKREMEKYFVGRYLPDADLSYLVEHTELFDDYVNAVEWAQDFARENRLAMMRAVVGVVERHLGDLGLEAEMAVNCHHNYISRERHFGQNVIVTRKGAVRARLGDLGIIPGSMGTGSFIVRGRGNHESFHSCSHGAGRAMSRGLARALITMEQHALAMKGIEGRLDVDVLDESPAAYKDIGLVMKAQESLVEIVHTLHQVLNVKG